MSNISKAFKNTKAFIPFLTGGDPTIDKTEEYIYKMAEAGADIIEIGIPFSDPIAEGPVIQEANIRALKNGATPERIFEMVERVRTKTQVPIVFLTYLNPVFNYGYDKFFARCKKAGVDGIIIPDMPFEEKGELAEEAKKNGVDIISLIAPTSADRIQMIAKEAQGYVYVVSSLGVTGMRSEIKTDLKSIIDLVKQATDIPAAVGFGINTPEQTAEISKISDGVIVGSAIVKIIEKYGENAAGEVYKYVKEMKDAIR